MDFSALKTTEGIDVAGKRVMVRADLNVPVRDGVVTDTTRISRVAPGILDLAARGARVIVLSHFGRPKGQRNDEFTLKPVADKLAQILAKPVAFAGDCIGEAAEQCANALADGEIAMFENLRFHQGEENNDPDFAKALARSADIYVGDAFSAAHRAHASNTGITNHLPAYTGPLMIEEIRALRAALDAPQNKTAAIVGGAKVSTKIPVLENLLDRVDYLIIGGGMANTFLQAQGIDVGKSLAEPDFNDTARKILKLADVKLCEIVLPIDAVIAREFKAGADTQIVDINATPSDSMILDIGPDTLAILAGVLAMSQTLLWNGPLGAFEIEPFGEGTFRLARIAAALTRGGNLKTIAGGGDTVAALNLAGAAQDFTYVSTAGGAFLEWLEGRELPGVVALTK